MSISTSPEFFINMKNPPIYDNSKNYWEQSKDVLEFYEEEKKKITYGVNINGYWVHPWLYFHCNYFKTPIPQEDGTEPIIVPPMRDNELFIAENYNDAEKSNKGMIVFGSRRFSKSTDLASITHWKALIKPNSQATVSGGSKEDLEMITRLIQTSMGEINHAFYMENNSNDWTSHIQLGLKTKANTPIVHSDIYIRNLEKGQTKKSEKTAGAAPSVFILDEALQKDTLIYLKDKTIPIKDIEIGDEIYGGDGKLTRVLEKHKFENRQLYKISFSDGREIECCENHLWSVRNNNSKEHSVKSTKELLEKFRYFQKDHRYGHEKVIKSIYSIPLSKAIEYEERDLLIDPYIMGLFTGDGNCHRGSFVSMDNQIIESIKDYAKSIDLEYSCYTPKQSPVCDVIHVKKKAGKTNSHIQNLKTLGTFKLKNINEIYERGSIEQRKQFIKGLGDTDGTIDKRGGQSISTSEERIKDSVVRILRSLGIRVKVSIKYPKFTYKGEYKQGKKSYVIHFYADECLFNLERKIDRFKKREGGKADFYRTRVNITNIEKSRIDDAYCIKVDNEDKLFIAGDYIVTHNCGKFDCIAPYTAALPSFKTPHGWKCVPILTGTSGNAELSTDAIKMMMNPETYDLLPMNWDRLENRIEEKDLITWKRRSFGIFVPGQFGYEEGNFKKETNLKDYLRIKTPSPDLEKIKLGETDWRFAKDLFINNRKKLVKDPTEYDKYVMYYPLDVDDILRSDNGNPFPIKEAQRHRQYLVEQGLTGKLVDLTLVGSKLEYTLSSKRPVEFPFGGGVHDAPVTLFDEIPTDMPPYGLNVSGLDPYKQTKAGTESVGAFYILRREGLLDDPFAGCILASYCSRPPIPDNFDRNCEWLIEGFNAQCLMENADIGFIRYLERKGKADLLLADGVDFSKRINPKASANTPYGLYPTPKNQSHLMKSLLNYCNEELIIGFDEDGSPRKALGITRINDIYLLDEIINYKAGGNFDRMIAFSHALAWADYLDAVGVKVESGEQQQKKEKSRQYKQKQFFTDTSKFSRWR